MEPVAWGQQSRRDITGFFLLAPRPQELALEEVWVVTQDGPQGQTSWTW